MTKTRINTNETTTLAALAGQTPEHRAHLERVITSVARLACCPTEHVVINRVMLDFRPVFYAAIRGYTDSPANGFQEHGRTPLQALDALSLELETWVNEGL